jgi:hypothetical protein
LPTASNTVRAADVMVIDTVFVVVFNDGRVVRSRAYCRHILPKLADAVTTQVNIAAFVPTRIKTHSNHGGCKRITAR